MTKLGRVLLQVNFRAYSLLIWYQLFRKVCKSRDYEYSAGTRHYHARAQVLVTYKAPQQNLLNVYSKDSGIQQKIQD